MNDNDRAMKCFENALRHNQYSIPALSHIASLCRAREQFQKVRGIKVFSLKGSPVCLRAKKIFSPPQAIDHFKIILSFQETNGEIWSALGHCYLMQENLQEAYQAYQQALYHLKNPRVSGKVRLPPPDIKNQA
jgi:glucose repression mediator protein